MMATVLDGQGALCGAVGVALASRRRRHIKHVARLIVHAVVHYDAHTPCCTCVNKHDGAQQQL